MHHLPHLVLVGLPGAGKSTVGPLLAAGLATRFLDFDAEIERREGRTVTAIFQQDGEAAFRTLERALSRELAEVREGMVLAPGGGWMADEANVTALQPNARIIHLAVSPRRALQRLGPAVSARPLLAGPASLARLEALAAARLPLYGMADGVINTEVLTPQQVADLGLRLASAWGWPIG